jgi:hypothetical protein
MFQDDHVGVDAVHDRCEHGGAVGEAVDREAEVEQFSGRCLAIVVVVVDED